MLDNAAYLHRGLKELGYRVVEPSLLPDGTEVITPIVPVVIGDDLPTATLWKALWDAGVYTNVALYPAVPPGRLADPHERDGDARARAPRPRARDLRGRAQAPGRTVPPAGPADRREAGL